MRGLWYNDSMSASGHSLCDLLSMPTQTSYCFFAQDKSAEGEVDILGRLDPGQFFSYQFLVRDINVNYSYMLPQGDYRVVFAASPAAFPTLKAGLPEPMCDAVVRSPRLEGHEFVAVYYFDPQ